MSFAAFEGSLVAFPSTLLSISSIQYETMDPYFVVKMMPLIAP
jgi:hypothetical protein